MNTTLRSMMLALLTMSVTICQAAPLDNGDAFPAMDLADQHDVAGKAPNGATWVIIAFEMPVAKNINKWLSTKKKSYLTEHKTLWIADVTPMPKVIASTFALPKMRKYPQRIFLVRDETFGDKFPKKAKQATALKLDAKGVVTDIRYVSTGADLGKLLEAK